jgi:hypothetical protein
MFGSSILETIIGLTFVYLLLSIIVSTAQELLESLIKKRAAELEKGIRLLLDDKEGKGLAKALFSHPLICCLYKYDYGKDGQIVPKSLPSYIPAKSFALALMDIVQPASQAQVSGVAGALGPTAASSPQPQSVQQLRAAIGNIANPNVQKALLALTDASGNDPELLRANIEMWFNSTMDRVSGWYRRWSQGIILLIGLVVTIGLNANTIAIVQHLSRDKETREKLVAAAEIAAAEKTAKPNANSESADVGKLRSELEKINSFGLPLGWSRSDTDWTTWPGKLVGWLLTALAIALGAPFWFDLLNKFLDVRSSLKADVKPKVLSEQRVPSEKKP